VLRLKAKGLSNLTWVEPILLNSQVSIKRGQLLI
jgi:hypothetical protein